MRKKKRNLRIALFSGFLLILITWCIIKVIWKDSSFVSFLLGVGGVIGGLASVPKWVKKQVPFIGWFTDLLEKYLGNEKPTTVSGNVNPVFVEDAKVKLIEAVEKYINTQLSHAAKNVPTLSGGQKIAVGRTYYSDLGTLPKIEGMRQMESISEWQKHKMLITGGEGAGKSTEMIMMVAEQIRLMKEAREGGNPKVLIPVLLSLNTWTVFHTKFKDWIIERLKDDYSLSLSQSEMLVNNCDVMIFADGLDEIRNNVAQQTCFENLLKYSESSRIVFSCRKQDIIELLEKVNVPVACSIWVLELTQLSKDIIQSSIFNTQVNAKEIIGFMQSKEELYAWLNTPFLLNLFLKVYEFLKPHEKEEIRQMNNAEFMEFLMGRFDNDVMEHIYPKYEGVDLDEWPADKVRTYMVKLAERMDRNNIFNAEDLQPSWFETGRQRLIYYLVSRIASGLLLSIGAGLVVAEPGDFIGNGLCVSLVVVVLTCLYDHFRFDKKLRYWGTILYFSIPTVVMAFLYQGLSVPRRSIDMYLGVFSRTESLAGILLGLFFGGVYGFRKSRQSALAAWSDVRPLKCFREPGKVNKFDFNWRQSVLAGLRGGLALGAFMGGAAVLIDVLLPGSTFHGWLEKNAGRYYHFDRSWLGVSPVRLQFFTLGGVIGFFAGLCFGLIMGGTGKNKKQEEQIIRIDEDDFGKRKVKRRKLDRGIRVAFLFGFKYGVFVLVYSWIVLGISLLLMTKDIESLKRVFYMGIGTGLVSFLWFGGFDVIHHYILRYFLYAYGITPIRFDNWIRIVEKTTLMRRVGSAVQFIHIGLLNYYAGVRDKPEGLPLIDLRRKGLLKPLYWAGIPLLLLGMAYPFILKHSGQYWKHPHHITLVSDTPRIVKTIGDHAVCCKKEGTLKLDVTGGVKVGTFTGTVSAAGTERGILVFPITDVYDTVAAWRHGALLYERRNRGVVSAWQPVIRELSLFGTACKASIKVCDGDTLFFMLNDKEYENNRFAFHVRMNFSDTTQYVER